MNEIDEAKGVLHELLNSEGASPQMPPMTWRERLRNRLFPYKHCFAPDANPDYKDTLTCRTTAVLSFGDRLKLLFTGRLTVVTCTVTENEVGENVTNSICYVDTKGRLKEQ